MDLTVDFHTGSASEISSSEAENDPFAHQHDLIGFLGLMRYFDVPLLPITWQPALGALGKGGTANVSQALVHASLSYAFKRMRAQTSFDKWIAEVRALSPLKSHPNIATLQACCLETLEDGRLSPVLIFEKAEFGDLETFADSEVAAKMTIQDEIHLCLEIGLGLRHIHRSGQSPAPVLDNIGLT